MVSGLRKEIKQTKPFRLIEQEAYLNIVRTAEVLTSELAEILKRHSISPAQYNVLRILRGAGETALACREVSERMLTRDPDITRLLDRLETAGLVVRTRDPKDRRVLLPRITPRGLETLAALDAPIDEAHVRRLGPLGKKNLKALIDLLEKIRENPR